MTQPTIEQRAEYYAIIQLMACEQLQFLTERYRMTPSEIIHLYTGTKPLQATTQRALHAIIAHRLTAELVPGRE